MIPKKLAYADLDGNPIEGTFWFHLSKAELTMLQVSKVGGMQQYLQKIVDDSNGRDILQTVRELIEMSIGERDESGKEIRFRKSDEYTRDFMDSNAFETLFMELVTDSKAAVDFITGLVPNDMRKTIANGGKDEDEREHSIRELVAMPQAQFDQIAGTDEMKMSRNQLVAAMQRKNRAA